MSGHTPFALFPLRYVSIRTSTTVQKFVIVTVYTLYSASRAVAITSQKKKPAESGLRFAAPLPSSPRCLYLTTSFLLFPFFHFLLFPFFHFPPLPPLLPPRSLFTHSTFHFFSLLRHASTEWVRLTGMEGLKILSLNVNGLNVRTKRRAIFDRIRSLNAHVCLLQETHSTDSIAAIWEAEWGGKILFNHGSASSRGVAILFKPGFLPSVTTEVSDYEGRFLLLDISDNLSSYSVGTVYAPTQDKPRDQLLFLDHLEEAMDELESADVIIGGDFNCIFSAELDKNSNTPTPQASDTYRLRLRALMEERSMCDAWRCRFPRKRRYTFRRGSYASRLDLFLTSTHLSEGARHSDPKIVTHSDHSILSISVGNSPTHRGPGLWKFDASLLLRQDFMTKATQFLEQWIRPPELSDPCSIWEWQKFEFKSFILQYTRAAVSQEKQYISSLQTSVEELTLRADEGEDLDLQVQSIKRELKELEDARANKLIFRSRARWTQLGEKPTSYFLNLQKRKFTERTLSSVALEDGSTSSDPKTILIKCREFYEKLYDENPSNLSPIAEVLEQIQDTDHPTLSVEDRDILDSPFTEQELKKALQQLNTNKCPGTDGFSPELYLAFWDLLAPNLVRSLSYSIESGLLSNNQRRGVINLIPKKDQDRRHIANWRPITILNTDYKILTKAMALRLQKPLDTIIHPNQSGFMKSRFIGDNLRLTEDALFILKALHPQGALVALDFSKAFDTVRWEFIYVSLRWFGFGERFIDLVKLIFNEIETCVLNAGTTSAYFHPKRGIRQGCCVSPYLFNIVVEVMAIYIRLKDTITGITLQDAQVKLSQYADDSTYFLSHIDALDPLLEFLEEFSEWSGLKINRTKSAILPARDPARLGTAYRNIPVVSEAKILGLWFLSENSLHNRYLWNFKPKLQQIRSTCNSWSLRNISLKGKVTIVNSLLVSLLQFPSSVTFTPPQVYDEYRRLITDFIWNGKKPKVAYNTLILPIPQGGLGLMDLRTRVKVSSIQWIRRLLLDRAPNTSTSLASFIAVQDIKAYLALKPGIPPPGIQHEPFYLNLFKLWDGLHGFNPIEEEHIRQEILWDNKRITSADVSRKRRTWESNGIRTLQNICHPTEARLLSHQELSDRYGVRCSFLDMLGLRMGVPLAWRQALSPDWSPTPAPSVRSGVLILLPGEQPMDVLNAAPKQLYRAYISLQGHASSAFGRWQESADPRLRISNDDEWRDLSSNIYKATRETKLQALHFKILNRIVPCGSYLQQIRITQEDSCSICGTQDSLQHFFYECQGSKSFWQSVFNWFSRVEDLRLEEIPIKYILLGLPQLAPNARKINAILISVKFFIHRQRLFHQGKLDLIHWLGEFRARLLVEREISSRENKLKRFATWKRILDALG